jgi:alpha-ketoglutarate-dependent taurine dioxygenase
LKTKIHGGNAIEILDYDLKKITTKDAHQIMKYYFNHLVVVFRKQNLSPSDMIDIAKIFGDPEFFDEKTVLQRSPMGVNGVQRVCAGFNEDGSPRGLFGHDDDLDWHANRPSAELDRKPIIFLYAAHDSAGSRISWANMAMAYDDLDEETKLFINNKKGIYGFEPNTYTKSFNIWKPHRNLEGQNFIRTNPIGIKGMFFPYYQFFGFKDVDENTSEFYKKKLYEHAYQEKYFYHHNYEDGDVLLGDQWLTVHKRWAIELKNRMLYRVSMDWKNINLRDL